MEAAPRGSRNIRGRIRYSSDRLPSYRPCRGPRRRQNKHMETTQVGEQATRTVARAKRETKQVKRRLSSGGVVFGTGTRAELVP